MNEKERKELSKFLSYVLRHKPDAIGLVLDKYGWAKVDALIELSSISGVAFSLEQLQLVVSENDKKRFSFSEDKSRIRASQGHSIEVDLRMEQQKPPKVLFHGTAERNLESIAKKGLIRGQRNHVHLCDREEDASSVGLRYGRPKVLTVLSRKMYDEGHHFYLSDNGVWLTSYVPSEYIRS